MSGTRTLRKNLRMALPDISEKQLDGTVKSAVGNYMRYWNEVFRIEHWSKERILDEVVLTEKGLAMIKSFIDSGKGCIFALPHMGNIDLAGSYLKALGGKPVAVVERLKSDLVYKRFAKYRTALGMKVLPHDDAKQTTMFRLIRLLKSGHGLCLVSDRDLNNNGITVDFLGDKVSFPVGPALLAVSTGCPLIPASPFYVGNKVHITFLNSIKMPKEGTREERVRQMTQQLADELAGLIKANPSSWLMLQTLTTRESVSSDLV